MKAGAATGAPKLELLAQQIMKTANRLGVSPETARDMVLLGKTHAGAALPETLAATAAVGAGAGALTRYLGDSAPQAPSPDPSPDPSPPPAPLSP